VARHVLRLWFYLSPGLYSLALLEEVNLLDDWPILRILLEINPFAILFEAYRVVIWGTPDGGPPTFPDWGALAALAVASTIFLALATVMFKRLEPNFAKVL
jgi:ABC-type polysaccharide/polyol phosphate export permease